MRTTLAERADRTSVPTFARLLKTELVRLVARRFTKVLLGLCVIGYLIAVAFLFTTHHQGTPADIAQATAQRDQQIVQLNADLAQYLAQAGHSAEQCGSPVTAADFPITEFLVNTPFKPKQVPYYSLAIGVGVAMAGFILAATFIGAEWSSKNIVGWLFWEPRRMRLMAAKLCTVTGVVVVLAVIAQAIWWLTARALLDLRGVPVSSLGKDSVDFWSITSYVQLRAALLALPLVWIGFAVAHLIRNTAAALGIGFVYLVVLESVLTGISPVLQPYLFTIAVRAWVSRDGTDVYGGTAFNPLHNQVEPTVTHISNLSGGITMAVYAAVLLVVSLVLFRRRDIA